MNYCCNRILACFVFCFVLMGTLSAQKKSDNNVEIGFTVGTTIYQGDLTPEAYGNLKRLKPSFTLYGGKWINHYFELQATYTHANITAFDSDWSKPAYKRLRNLSFATSIDELNARILFSPLGNPAYTQRHLYIYAFAGAGVAFTHVKRNYNNINPSFLNAKRLENLALDTTHSLPDAIPSISLGAGMRYALSPKFSLFGELSYRLPVNDYLDGFSYFTNTKYKDAFYSIGVGVSYMFIKDAAKCPRVNW